MFLRQNISWSRWSRCREAEWRRPPCPTSFYLRVNLQCSCADMQWNRSADLWPQSLGFGEPRCRRTDGSHCHPDPAAGSGGSAVIVIPVPGSEWTFHWGTGSTDRSQNHFLLASLHQLIMENQNLECLFPGKRSVKAEHLPRMHQYWIKSFWNPVYFAVSKQMLCSGSSGNVSRYPDSLCSSSLFFFPWITFWSVWPNRMDFCLGFVLQPERFYLIKTSSSVETEGSTVDQRQTTYSFTEMKNFKLIQICLLSGIWRRWRNVSGIWRIPLQLGPLLPSCLVLVLVLSPVDQTDGAGPPSRLRRPGNQWVDDRSETCCRIQTCCRISAVCIKHGGKNSPVQVETTSNYFLHDF